MSSEDGGKEGKKPEPSKKDDSDARRPGLPDESSVVEEKDLISPKGQRYRVLKTNEKDEYEEKEPGKKNIDDAPEPKK